MPGYEPVDLSAACTAGVEVLGDEPGDVPLGRVDLRGLPFLIGSEPPSAERCFLLPGVPAAVGIGRVARRVIVAHRLLEPGAPAGHAVGTPRPAGPASSPRTITARPATSPGWSARSPRRCARWKSTAIAEQVNYGNRGPVWPARSRIASGEASEYDPHIRG